MHTCRYVELKDELDKQSHEAKVLWAQLEQSSHHQQLMQCEQLKESIKSQESVLADALESEISLKTQLKELEHKIKVCTCTCTCSMSYTCSYRAFMRYYYYKFYHVVI